MTGAPRSTRLGRLHARLVTLHPLVLITLALTVAQLLRMVFNGYWGDQFPFLPFFPAILICALVSGWGYGALAAAGAAVLHLALGAHPADGLTVAATVVFLISNALMIALAESARRARERAQNEATIAQESQRRFNLMADSVPLMIWVHDAAGRLQFVNRGWEAFFGVSQERARRDGWQHLLHEDDRALYEAQFLEALRWKRPFTATARARRADGEWRWIESHGVPRLGTRGELVSFAGTSHDVTERRELELEREVLLESERAARTEAETATRAKDEFLATLSHELRTPLSVIVLWSRILARKYGTGDEDLRKGLALIIDNGMALSQLIGDLLDMSRIVSGRVTLENRPLDVAELLSQTVASHRPAADSKRISLELQATGESAPVLGDPTRLQQVFWNLLANAVKFTPDNGHIWVSVAKLGARVEIAVRDDGEGIAAEFLSQIFSRFRQADSSSARKHGGLGIGLAVVKQLVELHGGDVRALSPGPGCGSTFVVTLPLHEANVSLDTDASGTWRRLDPDRALVGRLEGRRVLAVEDQPDMLDSLRRMLEDQGAQVTPAGSGAAALELLRQNPLAYDVIVSDIGMPQMDGYELIRRIRNELGLGPQRLAAIALTAYARDEDRTRALRAGFQAHLAKPYQVGQLVAILDHLPTGPRIAREHRHDEPRSVAL